MPEDNEANPDKSEPGKSEHPTPTPEGDPNTNQRGPSDPKRPSERRKSIPIPILKELNANERVTAFLAFCSLLVAVASAGVAYNTYRVTADTSDIKHAVSGLSELAKKMGDQASQSKRQADALEKQLGAVNAQVQALKDQAAEAKAQTKAISQQTTAIKSSSAAAVKSAGAQIETAIAEKQTATVIGAASAPKLTFLRIDITGMDGAPNKDGIVEVKIRPRFANTGGSTSYGNRGVFVVSEDWLPPVPDYTHGIAFGGNDINVSVGGDFGPSDPITFGFTPANAKASLAGTRAIYVYGYTEYRDGTDILRRKCFAERITMPRGDRPMYYFEVRLPAYQCQT